jgi:hypothetical protein
MCCTKILRSPLAKQTRVSHKELTNKDGEKEKSSLLGPLPIFRGERQQHPAPALNPVPSKIPVSDIVFPANQLTIDPNSFLKNKRSNGGGVIDFDTLQRAIIENNGHKMP